MTLDTTLVSSLSWDCGHRTTATSRAQEMDYDSERVGAYTETGRPPEIEYLVGEEKLTIWYVRCLLAITIRWPL